MLESGISRASSGYPDCPYPPSIRDAIVILLYFRLFFMLPSTLPRHQTQGNALENMNIITLYMTTKQLKYCITADVILTGEVSRESQAGVALLCDRFPSMRDTKFTSHVQHRIT
jgi:hypothetical protein